MYLEKVATKVLVNYNWKKILRKLISSVYEASNINMDVGTGTPIILTTEYYINN